MLASFLGPFLDFQWLSTRTLPVNPMRGLDTDALLSSGNVHGQVEISCLLYFLATLYWSGVMWMIGKLLLGIFKTIWMIRDSDRISYKGFKVALNPDFRPSSFFNLILMHAKPSPEESFEQVFKHESMHVQLGHSWDVMMIQVIQSFLWLNPVVFLFERSLKELHEYQADAGVIAEYSSFSYSGLLLGFASSKHPNWKLISGFN